MGFIVIEKVNKEERSYNFNIGRYSILAIIGFVLSILEFFVSFKIGLIIFVVSIVLLFMSFKYIKNNLKSGKNLARLGLVICVVYIIIIVVLKMSVNTTKKKSNQKVINNAACSLVDAKGHYYSNSGNIITSCNNFICTIQDNEAKEVTTFECK